MAKFLDIIDKYRELCDNIEIDEATGEFLNTEELDKASGELDEKAINIGLYIKECAVLIAAIADEIKVLQKRKKALENKMTWLKNYLYNGIVMAGREKNLPESARIKFSFHKSQTTEVFDEELLPTQYIKVKTETAPDKEAIKKAIKAGESVPGAKLVDNVSLVIK